MKVENISDKNIEEILETKYDISIFAIGSEKRCRAFAQKLHPKYLGEVILVGYVGGSEDRERKINDQYFSERFNAIIGPNIHSHDDSSMTRGFTRELQKLITDTEKRINILIDYTCMSRSWLGGLLFSLFNPEWEGRLQVDFGYSIGAYEHDGDHGTIDKVLAIPGLEGSSAHRDRSLAVMGLGFYRDAALCVLDKLEVDEILPVIASPALSEEFANHILDKNAKMLRDTRSLSTLSLPFRSVETACRYLIEELSPLREKRHVILVPMGPKTHSLAFMLSAFILGFGTCLRVSLVHSGEHQASSTGEFLVCRVTL